MPQIFHRSTNTIARVSIVGLMLTAGVAAAVAGGFFESTYLTGVAVPREQPIPFSHEHHAGELGIDCRYCHTSVETSWNAGFPPTQTCINCHSQIWALSPALDPVRSSWRTGESIEWTKVYDLPDFVYFNHSIHVAKGVGCASCHGRIDKMNLTWQQPSLHMEWCLECHRNPAPNVRPRSEVFNMDWQPPADQPNLGAELVAAHKIKGRDDCTACHR